MKFYKMWLLGRFSRLFVKEQRVAAYLTPVKKFDLVKNEEFYGFCENLNVQIQNRSI